MARAAWVVTAMVLAALGAVRVQAPPGGASATGPDLDGLFDRLGDDSWEQRDAATQQLIGMGLRIRAELQARLARETDLEVQYRLRYILENIVVPDVGVLVVRADAATGLSPGDLITHVAGRRVSTAAELRTRMESFAGGVIVRAIGSRGPREAGPLFRSQLEELADYVAPRGETIAQAVRQYAHGFAEDAYRLVLDAGSIPEGELSRGLRARIAYCAGDAARALGWLDGLADLVRPPSAAPSVWSGPSELDLRGPGKAPFHLELALFTQGGPALYAAREDPDLRVQRVYVPAGRYVDALLRSADLWTHEYHLEGDAPGRRDSNIAGNQLAIASWMFNELELRSECCRLIEPRSAILRRTARAGRKWVRVETDAWLPFLAGDEKAAVDGFYDDAMDVLQQPPRSTDPNAVIRNPLIAARLAFFLYQLPEDRRTQDALAVVAHPTHPALQEYVDWMLLALQDTNQDLIRRHLLSILPNLPDSIIAPYARAVALLEYVQARPDPEILQAARQRIFQSTPGDQRDLWLAIVESLIDLTAGRPSDALRTLESVGSQPENAALLATARFLDRPPAAAANHDSLRAPLLVLPSRPDSGQWVVLARDRRLMLFDERAGTLAAMPPPDAHWYPSPLTWPWLGREAGTGRTWAYARRRVIEITPGGASPLRMNIRTRDIATFDRCVAASFSVLADAVEPIRPAAGENGEFLRGEVRKHADCVSDPDLPDLGIVRPLREDPRLIHVALRGGPHLLLEPSSGRAWSSQWFAGQAGLATPPVFFAQALWPEADRPPVAILTSDQGLLRFDVATETVSRIAVPGDEPFPRLIPESAPYDRRDPRFVYVARVPEDGGRVYRLIVANGQVEPLDLVNEALPRGYYDVHLRSDIRRAIDDRLKAEGIGGIESFVADAILTVEGWDQPRQEQP